MTLITRGHSADTQTVLRTKTNPAAVLGFYWVFI